MTTLVEIRPAGDSAVVVELGTEIDPTLNAHVIAIAAQLRRERIEGVRDVVSSYAAVTVYFDPVRTNFEALTSAITRHVTSPMPEPTPTLVPLEVPVCYGGVYGPDLNTVADYSGCSADDVIQMHAVVTYRVYLLGFVPGFAYLGRVNDRIAMPRRETPRLSVAAGTVGIAGCQTGIYPLTTPGGWQLIGRTATCPFDPARDEPLLFTVGDSVRFVPIDEKAFRQAIGKSATGGVT